MCRKEELHCIKSIAPEIILNDLGIPFVKRPSYIEAPAIWREEKRPSVSIIQQNDFGEWLWHDFGNDKGGSWIDLVMVLYDWDYVTAVKFLREKYLGNSEIRTPRIIPKSQKVSAVRILEVKKVSYPALKKVTGSFSCSPMVQALLTCPSAIVKSKYMFDCELTMCISNWMRNVLRNKKLNQ